MNKINYTALLLLVSVLTLTLIFDPPKASKAKKPYRPYEHYMTGQTIIPCHRDSYIGPMIVEEDGTIKPLWQYNIK